MKPTATRVVGYVRVSTEEQVDGRSLSAQRREIEQYAETNGLTLVGIYADEGASAHNDRIDKRPQLSALLADASRGSFDAVVVHTIDRWARNIHVQTEALKRLGAADIGFISLTENIDFSTPSGKLMLTMIGGFAEFFSDQLAVHVVKSQRQRAEAGLPVGPVPFGYEVIDPGGMPCVEARAGEAVRRLFAMRVAGESNGVIAGALNREGFSTRTGRLFTAHAIKDLLTCRFYIGVVTFRGEEFPGSHEALVSLELFERAQSRRMCRQSSPRIVGKPRGVLSGLLRCARCGNSLHSDRNRTGTPMYRERHGWPCDTNRRALVAPPIDAQVGDIFRSIELRPDWLEEIAQIAGRDEGPSRPRLVEKKKRLARAYADGGYTLADYEARMVALDAEIRLSEDATPVEVTDIAALLGDLPALWLEATADERRALLAPLIDGAFVDVESRRITGIDPKPAFRTLVDAATQRAVDFSAVLLAPREAPVQGAYGLGGDGGESNSPSRRKSVTDLLQA